MCFGKSQHQVLKGFCNKWASPESKKKREEMRGLKSTSKLWWWAFKKPTTFSRLCSLSIDSHTQSDAELWSFHFTFTNILPSPGSAKDWVSSQNTTHWKCKPGGSGRSEGSLMTSQHLQWQEMLIKHFMSFIWTLDSECNTCNIKLERSISNDLL